MSLGNFFASMAAIAMSGSARSRSSKHARQRRHRGGRQNDDNWTPFSRKYVFDPPDSGDIIARGNKATQLPRQKRLSKQGAEDMRQLQREFAILAAGGTSMGPPSGDALAG